MKKIIALTIAMAATLSMMAQNVTLKGQMVGFGESAKMILNKIVDGNKVKPLDTIDLGAKGRYKTTFSVDRPSLFIITFTRDNSPNLFLMAMPDDNLVLSAEYVQTNNSVRVTETRGSKDMDLFRQFNNASLDPQAPRLIHNLLDSNSNCLMAAFLVTIFDKQVETYYPLYEKIRNQLIGIYPDDPMVKHIDQIVRTTILPGKEAPEIAMKDANGNIRRLSDLRGKVVMIDFWASWCRPCRGENPNVVRMYKKYKDRGFDIYSVSMDNDRASWLNAIQADGLEWDNHVSDLKGWTSSGGATYGITSIPATVLLDREGRVIARNLRGAELERKLKEIFGE